MRVGHIVGAYAPRQVSACIPDVDDGGLLESTDVAMADGEAGDGGVDDDDEAKRAVRPEKRRPV